MSMVRASALSGYRELVTELGGSPEALLAELRIPTPVLDEPQAFVPYASLIRLLEHSAVELACPDFGLRLSRRQDLSILGPLGVAVRNCESLGDAMRCASRYMFVHSPAISFTPQPADRDDRLLLMFEILLVNVGPTVQVTELSVGLAARIVHMLVDKPKPVLGVHFRHRRLSPLDVYEAHFDAPISFESRVSALELDRKDLALPIQNASSQLRELAESYLQLQDGDSSKPLSSRVRMVIQRSLGTGATSCADVAAVFALHPRALQRQLRREGTTFGQLKDEARAELARGYIANRDLPMSHIAALLDYSEQSAFTRGCKRWFGKAPQQMRADG